MAAMFSRHFQSVAFTCRAQDPGNGQSRTTRTLAGNVNQSEVAIQWLLIRSKQTIKFVCFESHLSCKMPKRNFPFDGTSPLQLKTHINAFHFEKLNDMDKIYGKFGTWQCRLPNFIKRNFCLSIVFLCMVFHSTEWLWNDLLSLKIEAIFTLKIPTERTREMMQKGTKRLQQEEAEKKRETNVQTDQVVKCLSCLQSKRFGISCVFCERQLCVDCSHQCSKCAESFCNLCSIAK